MRRLSHEELSSMQDYPDENLEGEEYIEATIGELMDLEVGTQCGTIGNKCMTNLTKFKDRLIRCLYSEEDKLISGTPRIQCGEEEAEEIQKLAEKGNGSLRTDGADDNWPGFHVFEIE